MGEQIVKSYNLFLNSDDATNDGMRYDFQLGNNSIVCGAGQYLRLSLNNYSQYVTWSNVNSYNNVAYLRTTIGGAGVEYFPVTITPGNYASIADLALDLGTKVATALGTLPFPWGAASLSIPSVSPPAGVGVGGTTDNRISFEVTFATGWTTAPDTTNGDLALQCLYDSESLTDATLVTNPLTGILADQAHAAQGGDVGLLLGGDRLISTAVVSSCQITASGTGATSKLSFQFPYPAQRSTEANLYLRINPPLLVNGTENFAGPLVADPNTNRITTTGAIDPTNILAELRINTEFVQYSPTSGREFFADYYQKALNHIHIFITDKNNRSFPQSAPSTSGTLANGQKLGQSVSGNMHFTTTLRVDVIQGKAIGEGTIAKNINPGTTDVPARFENLLIQQKFGESTYGKPMGF